MAVDLSAARWCTRCSYDLRGQVEPRCPECGLTFTPAQWQAEILRGQSPTRLDRVDPWQPHQVLWAGLCDLVHALVDPRWVIREIDLAGPRWAAVLALVTGLLWVKAACVVALAWATCRMSECSPYGGLTVALSHHLYVLWFEAFLGVTVTFSVVSEPWVLRVPKLLPQHFLRLAGWWVPAATALSVAPIVGVALVWPDMLGAVWGLGPVVAALVSLRAGRILRGGAGPRSGWLRQYAGPALLLLWIVACRVLTWATRASFDLLMLDSAHLWLI